MDKARKLAIGKAMRARWAVRRANGTATRTPKGSIRAEILPSVRVFHPKRTTGAFVPSTNLSSNSPEYKEGFLKALTLMTEVLREMI